MGINLPARFFPKGHRKVILTKENLFTQEFVNDQEKC